MFLYEQRDDYVIVHSLEANEKKIYDYKKSEMENLPANRRVFKAISSYGKPLEDDINEIEYSELDNSELIYTPYPSRFETCYSDSKLLVNYYNNQRYPIGKLVLVNHPRFDDIRYILVTEPYYRWVSDLYQMDNIINIPRNIYIFESFIRNQLSSIDLMDSDELTKILQLFDFNEEISSINLTELQKIYQCGIIETPKSFLDYKINQSQKVLSKIRTSK